MYLESHLKKKKNNITVFTLLDLGNKLLIVNVFFPFQVKCKRYCSIFQNNVRDIINQYINLRQ